MTQDMEIKSRKVSVSHDIIYMLILRLVVWFVFVSEFHIWCCFVDSFFCSFGGGGECGMLMILPHSRFTRDAQGIARRRFFFLTIIKQKTENIFGILWLQWVDPDHDISFAHVFFGLDRSLYKCPRSSDCKSKLSRRSHAGLNVFLSQLTWSLLGCAGPNLELLNLLGMLYSMLKQTMLLKAQTHSH